MMKKLVWIVKFATLFPSLVIVVILVYGSFFWLKPESKDMFPFVGVLLMVALLIVIPVSILFIAHVWRSSQFKLSERAALTVAIVLVPVISLPIYAFRFYRE